MELPPLRIAGGLLFSGVLQILVVIIGTSALYPGYSVRDNFISDLGIGPSAALFNSSFFILGLCLVLASYLIGFDTKFLLSPVFLGLSGFGAVMIGLFPESIPPLHLAGAFLFGAAGLLAAISAYWLEDVPLNYFSVFVGVFSTGVAGFIALGIDFNLGAGGMERLLFYPYLLWITTFGGYLVAGLPLKP